MVTNSASLGHFDNVKRLMPWHETLYNLLRVGGVMTMYCASRSSISAPLNRVISGE